MKPVLPNDDLARSPLYYFPHLGDGLIVSEFDAYFIAHARDPGDALSAKRKSEFSYTDISYATRKERIRNVQTGELKSIFNRRLEHRSLVGENTSGNELTSLSMLFMLAKPFLPPSLVSRRSQTRASRPSTKQARLAFPSAIHAQNTT